MEKSIDEIMNEMNDQAKAEGRYLGMAFWEIPRAQGSILDVSSTPEAEKRLAALRAERLIKSKRDIHCARKAWERGKRCKDYF